MQGSVGNRDIVYFLLTKCLLKNRGVDIMYSEGGDINDR